MYWAGTVRSDRIKQNMVGKAADSLSECELSGANDDRHVNESCFVVTKAECMMAVVGTCVVEIRIDV